MSISNDVKIEVARLHEMRTSRRMGRQYQDFVREWVRANLKRLGWSQAELSRKLNKKDASYIGHSMRGARDFKAQEINAMEKLFGNPPEAKPGHFSVDLSRKSVSNIACGEIITTGYREHAAMILGAQQVDIPVVDVPAFKDLEKQAWLVEGDGADLYVQSGQYVIVVDYFSARSALHDRDKVVVKRYHPVRFSLGDLSHAENSIRLLKEDGDGFLLKSLSSNPDIRDIPYNPSDKSVVIHKLIIGGAFSEKYE